MTSASMEQLAMTADASPDAPSIDVRRLPGSSECLIQHDGGLFPILAALPDGRILGVLRSGTGHHGIGRIELVSSFDAGMTWSPGSTLVDTTWDDSNKAFGAMADGTVVLLWHARLAYDEHGWMGEDPVRSKLTQDRVWTIRSLDGGWTWEQQRDLGIHGLANGSPYGRVVEVGDGTILAAVYVSTPDAAGKLRSRSALVASTDRGVTWAERGTIGSGFNETALHVLADRSLIAVMREDVQMALHLARSNDGGRTWSAPRQVTGPSEHPADMARLADGRLLLAFGRRRPPYRIEAMVSRDDGWTWEPMRLLFSPPLAGWTGEPRFIDLGYPSIALVGEPGDRTGVIAWYVNPEIRGIGDLSDMTNPLYSPQNYRAVGLRWSERELLHALDAAGG